MAERDEAGWFAELMAARKAGDGPRVIDATYSLKQAGVRVETNGDLSDLNIPLKFQGRLEAVGINTIALLRSLSLRDVRGLVGIGEAAVSIIRQ
jgi:hypothetical protein